MAGVDAFHDAERSGLTRSKVMTHTHTLSTPLSLILTAICSLLGLLLFMEAFLAQALLGVQDASLMVESENTIFLRLASLSFYMLLMVLLAGQWRQILAAMVQNWMLLAIAGLFFMSVAWSFDPATSLRRAVAYMLSTLFAIYLAVRFTPRQFAYLIATAFGLAVFFSLVYVAVAPSMSIHQTGDKQGNWAGVFAHKQQFGIMSSFAGVFFMWLFIYDPANKGKWIALTVFSGICVMGSQSATAILIMFLGIAQLYFVSRLRSSAPMIVVIVIAGVVLLALGGYVAINHQGMVLSSLGKEGQLTGRLPLWLLLIVAGQQAMPLGYGYGTFWDTDQGELVNSIVGWFPNSAHNGFLEVWLATGWVGLVLLCVFMGVFVRRAVFDCVQGRPFFVWCMLLFTATVLANFSRSDLAEQNTMIWMLFMASFVMMNRIKTVDGIEDFETLKKEVDEPAVMDAQLAYDPA